MGGQLLAVVLLGDHVIEPGLEAVADWRHRSLPAEGGDGALQLAAVIAQFVRCQGVKRVPGFFYWVWAVVRVGCGGWHWPSGPYGGRAAERYLLLNLSGR
jgi:hypothetical protein